MPAIYFALQLIKKPFHRNTKIYNLSKIKPEQHLLLYHSAESTKTSEFYPIFFGEITKDIFGMLGARGAGLRPGNE